jgi:hypothetical protein
MLAPAARAARYRDERARKLNERGESEPRAERTRLMRLG